MGERLREARRARNLSLRTLAERLGVSPSLISQIETGRANPSVSTLYAIAAELDVSLDELLFNDRRPRRARGPGPAGGADQRDDGARAARPARRRPARDPARVGGQLGAADDTVRTRRRVPPRDLRGRRGVEPARCLPAPPGSRVGLRPERPPPGPDRVRRVRPRAGRRDLDQFVHPAPARDASATSRSTRSGSSSAAAQFDAQTLIDDHLGGRD